MRTEHRKFGAIPTALVYKTSAERAAKEGCILCYHGFASSNDAWLQDLEDIAEHGFLANGVDAVGHGERRYPDFEERFTKTQAETDEAFIRVVEETSAEVPALVDDLMKSGLVSGDKLGMFGVSMGGFITYAAILKEPRLKVAVTLVSSPEWWMVPSLRSPHNHLGAFDRIKLLSQTAGRDEVVPSRYARAFHEQLKIHYDDYAERFKYTDYPASNHQMNPDWDIAVGEAIGWFKTYLRGLNP